MSAARHSPAAMRNAEPITLVLRDVLPPSGLVLEIASGTGEHAVHFARSLPTLEFQTTDPDSEALASITAHAAEATLPNLRPPLRLDVHEPWPIGRADAVLCINMVHISPPSATPALLGGAARVLPEGSPLVLYGPFLREGVPTAPSNLAFDASLKERNPQWGLRDLSNVIDEAGKHGLALARTVELPANNLAVVFKKAR